MQLPQAYCTSGMNLQKGKFLGKMNNSIGVPGLNRNDAYNLKIPLPPLEAQEKIVQAIENIEQKISNLQTELNSLNGKQKEILEKYLF